MNTADAFSRLLAAWRLRPPRDPNFRAAVWTRITLANTEPGWRDYLRAHASLVTSALMLALLVGGWVGREEARSRVSQDRAELAQAYVQALDARIMAQP